MGLHPGMRYILYVLTKEAKSKQGAARLQTKKSGGTLNEAHDGKNECSCGILNI